jgi:hypothetical protein
VAAKLKIGKRGDEIKKTTSPLKLLSQSQSNFAEMIIGWSPFKIVSGISYLQKLCPVIPTSNQDVRQAKNRKKGEEIKKKSSPLKLLSQSQPNFAEIMLGWSPSKIMSGISDLRPRWPPQPNLI